MHDLQVQSRRPHSPLLFLLLLPPELQKALGVMGTLQGKRSRVPPHPLLPAARTSPAEPWVCIPLRLPRTWGGIKGKVARACLIKGLWTETKPEVAEGTRVRGQGRERVGPGRCALPPAGRGASGHREACTDPRFCQRSGQAAPGAGRHREGQPFLGRLLSACDHIWSGEEASWLLGLQLSARAQTVPRKCLCCRRRGFAHGWVVNNLQIIHQSFVSSTG